MTVASDVEVFEGLHAVMNWLHGVRHAAHYHPLLVIRMWKCVRSVQLQAISWRPVHDSLGCSILLNAHLL